MLIRSQDKKRLLNLNNTVAIEALHCNVCAVTTDHDYQVTLGTYSTGEKAKAVLDKICKCYENYQATPQSNAVFDMPADEDVEV